MFENDSSSLSLHVLAMLVSARNFVEKNSAAIFMSESTGDVNSKGDQTLGIDAGVESILVKYVHENFPTARIFSEEIGEIPQVGGNCEYTIVFDPIDGSNNFRTGKGALPYGTFVAIYKGKNPKIKEVLSAGMIEHTAGMIYLCDESRTIKLDGSAVSLLSKGFSKSTMTYLDLYYHNGYKAYASFAEHFSLRDSGSQAGNLRYLLSGISAMTGGVSVGAEEIGTIYALASRAGGVVVDHEGNDVGNLSFETERKYQILAGRNDVVEFVLKAMRK